MNGNSPMISHAPPFVMRLSKDERKFFSRIDFSNLGMKRTDRVLAKYYGFTDEELDFPSSKLRTGNYDIEYRMRCDAENEEE